MSQAIRHRSYSAIAVLFIALVVSDSAFIFPCCDQVAGIPVSNCRAAQFCSESGEQTISVQEDNGCDEDSCEDCGNECFCCATFLPGLLFSPEASIIKPHRESMKKTLLPAPPPRSAFHPPRFA